MSTKDTIEPPRRSWLRWFFEDAATGTIVIAQFPNWPLWLFLAAWAAQAVLRPQGHLATALVIAKAAGLTIWAVDEVARGVCPWRRVLGAGALVAEVVAWIAP